MKTDHKAIILPAAVKLKPLRLKHSIRDYREHRKIKFYSKLLEHDWSPIYSMDLEATVDLMHSVIETFMDECFPKKIVRMSSRDPP